MSVYTFPPGTTEVSIYFEMRDALSGQGKTGLTPATPGAAASYTRNRSAAQPFALVALGAVDAPWISGGFIEISQANARGLYRLDVPNNAMASGVPHAVVNLSFDNTFDDGALILLRTQDSNVGPGATAEVVTVTRPDTSPIQGAQVWVTTDEAGSNTIAGALTTDVFGKATFFLDPGSYFLWVQAPDFTGTNPSTLTVL